MRFLNGKEMKQMKRELYEKSRLQEVEFDFKISIAAIIGGIVSMWTEEKR